MQCLAFRVLFSHAASGVSFFSILSQPGHSNSGQLLPRRRLVWLHGHKAGSMDTKQAAWTLLFNLLKKTAGCVYLGLRAAFRWSCAEAGVGLDDPSGSVPTWDIL